MSLITFSVPIKSEDIIVSLSKLPVKNQVELITALIDEQIATSGKLTLYTKVEAHLKSIKDWHMASRPEMCADCVYSCKEDRVTFPCRFKIDPRYEDEL